jgi:hypothetical protein
MECDALSVGDITLEEFFANLDWTYNGRHLWRAASTMFADIRILSTSNSDGAEHEEAVRGKKRWIHSHLKTIPDDHIYVVEKRRYKALYASETSILVDDLPDTIREWENKGGIGILHRDDQVEQTIAELDRIANSSKLGEIAKSLPIVKRGFWNRK